MSQSLRQIRKLELETELLQFQRLNSKAAQKRFVSHFAHEQLQGCLRHCEEGRAVQRAGDHLREFRVAYRLRADDVHWPVDCLSSEGEFDRRKNIVDCNPAPIL